MTRFIQATVFVAFVASAVTGVLGSVLVERDLEVREDVQNIVYVTDANKFWWVCSLILSPWDDCLTAF